MSPLFVWRCTYTCYTLFSGLWNICGIWLSYTCPIVYPIGVVNRAYKNITPSTRAKKSFRFNREYIHRNSHFKQTPVFFTIKQKQKILYVYSRNRQKIPRVFLTKELLHFQRQNDMVALPVKLRPLGITLGFTSRNPEFPMYCILWFPPGFLKERSYIYSKYISHAHFTKTLHILFDNLTFLKCICSVYVHC